MANLRLVNINAPDSRTIKASFTENLDTSINSSNITITSNNAGIANPEVLDVKIKNNILTAIVRPLIPFAAYTIEFKSTNAVLFQSINGQSILFEDGKTNTKLILGPEEPANPIRDNLLLYLKDNIYNLNRGTFIRLILNQISESFLRARYDIKQIKNDNYLNITILNERKIRGKGPVDRLNEEGAYQILRVGRTQENITKPGVYNFPSFPFDPVSLLSTSVVREQLEIGTGTGTFDGLFLTVENGPVTKLSKIIIVYQDGYTFNYNIGAYGYQIAESKYDTDFASNLITLSGNQFKLSDTILDNEDFRIPGSGDLIYIDYEYKLLGKNIDQDSIVLSQVLDAVREAAPPILNEFSLKHAPIVTTTDAIPISGGVEFLDPNANPPFSDTHPAFEKELPFRFSGLPNNPGEYSIDYETGRIFVFGADNDNTGTGNYPPAVNYKYRKVFRNELDYNYNPDTSDLVANPLRDLSGEIVKISYDFEHILVPDIDYKTQIHQESLDERIENRLKTTNSLSTNHTPITNVFRIFNETTGEIYRITRFSKDTVYFSANILPNISEQKRERISFIDVLNETLIVQDIVLNSSSVKIFKILLKNNKIMSATEDVIGANFNSSISFSRTDLFEIELYFDGQILTESQNLERLEVGQYQVDYENGIVYLAVNNSQTFDVGTISYKKGLIKPANSHLIAVSELYHSIDRNIGPSKRINYVNFGEGFILPTTFDRSDERFIDADESDPFVFASGNIEVSNDIKSVRHVFDVYDLNNNLEPTDFVETATFTGSIITLDSIGIQKRETLVVGSGLTITVSTISPGIELVSVKSVIRTSDNIQLIDGYQSISGNTITLSVSSGAVVGNTVEVIYNVVMNASATPIIDYDRGEYYADYTYLDDEILVSYEYGDNCIDFSETDSLEEGDEYFVSYKAGALRDALLANFGSLVDLPEIRAFDLELPREIYRGALIGALQSFTKGPTIPAFKTIVSSITKIKPEIEEAIFQVWSLGNSKLFPRGANPLGEPQYVSGKFDQGVLVENAGNAIVFPVSNNLRLEEGSLEMWVNPEWNGLDNDATLTFENIKKDSYTLSATSIFIGSTSYNPIFDDNGNFIINKNDEISPAGLPSAIFTKTGLFIYYDEDLNRWKFIVKDRATDGYVYSGKIISSGEVYDVKFIEGLGEASDVLRSHLNYIDFEFKLDVNDSSSPDGYAITDGYMAGYSFDGIMFMADNEHYLFDFAGDADKNRFSLYKDGRGYLNFRVYDNGQSNNQIATRRNRYEISADISGWEAGEWHHVGISWRLNSLNRQDEMHLFIDGFEVPNILYYGGKPLATSSDRFRTVKPEIVAGTVPLKSVTGNDLSTTAGSNIVISDSINFQNKNITPGHTIEIREIGFSTYIITAVNGTSLTLDANMPTTLTNARFSVNQYSVVVSSAIDLYKNIMVSLLRNDEEIEIPGVRADVPGYEITKNAFNENVLTILGDAEVGDQILVRTLGMNHRRCRERVYLWGEQSVLKTSLPPPINLDEVNIYAVPLPLTSIGPANAIFGSGVFTTSLEPSGQPTNSTEGRTLAVRVTGGNVDFTTATTVTIDGYTEAGPINEALNFSAADTQYTTNKFTVINSVDVVTKPIISSRDGIGVEIKERYSAIYPNGNDSYPVIRFAFNTQGGTTLSGDGGVIVSDNNGFFAASDIGNLLVITSPGSVDGIYEIEDKLDNTTVRINTAPGTAFTGGVYNIYNVSIGRSGFQNGFFFLETAGQTNTPYLLPQGYYEFDYSTYLEVPFDPLTQIAHIGTDYTKTKPAKAIIDEFRILSEKITDTRVGETVGTNQDSFTVDAQLIRPLRKNVRTLMLLNFDNEKLLNNADFYTFAERGYIQSSASVNDNFNQSIALHDRGLTFDNKGRLTTKSEGTIEFWVSPKFDTYNDPVARYYFDATSAVVEEITSTTRGTVKVSGRTTNVLSVRLVTDTSNTGFNYFNGGSIGSDFRTIQLGRSLPYQQTPVKVSYIPSGLRGNRISIYKDTAGFITFNVRASGIDYQVRQPVFWPRDTWHRIRATYKFNRTDNNDEIRLFVDGEEKGVLLFGSGLLFGDSVIFGQTTVGVTNQILIDDINFIDPLNQFTIGSDYTGISGGAQARFDNFRLSNISRDPITIVGQPKDVNFSSNLDVVYPVIEDAFTTYLLDFEKLVEKTNDFALLKDAEFGLFNFTLNVIDSFGIIGESDRVRQILESMIKALKPANSKVEINYFP